jgi:hypothetical protein
MMTLLNFSSLLYRTEMGLSVIKLFTLELIFPKVYFKPFFSYLDYPSGLLISFLLFYSFIYSSAFFLAL